MRKGLRKIGFLVFISGVISSCATLSYYDPTSYKSLTEIKPSVAYLYESFKESSFDDEKVVPVRLRLDQIYEYEKGKGIGNQESAGQIEEIRGMFQDHLVNRKKQGVWNETQYQNALGNIMEAFDVAIKTEALKNKNE